MIITKIIRKLAKMLLRPKSYAKFIGVRFGRGCKFMTKEFGTEPYLIEIGNNVEITSGVRFINHDGALWCIRNLHEDYRLVDIVLPINIGDNVYIGNNAILLPGVTVHPNTIIGANTILLSEKTYGPGVIAGTPGKKVCSYDEYLDKKRDKFEFTKNLTYEAKRQFYSDKFRI